MSKQSKVSEFIEGYKLASRMVRANDDLPPTYGLEGQCSRMGHGFTQLFPDKISDENLQKKIDYSNKCDREFQQWKKQHQK